MCHLATQGACQALVFFVFAVTANRDEINDNER